MRDAVHRCPYRSGSDRGLEIARNADKWVDLGIQETHCFWSRPLRFSPLVSRPLLDSSTRIMCNKYIQFLITRHCHALHQPRTPQVAQGFPCAAPLRQRIGRNQSNTGFWRAVCCLRTQARRAANNETEPCKHRLRRERR